jgi:prepilin-type N-terminal cleavage/methylation domain-containing protein
MKKGYTLIELIISMAILAVIMAAVATIFVTSIKNYRTESQKSAFQRELNFVVDNISKDVKEAAEVPQNYDVFALAPTVLILAIPATNSSNNFIYTGEVLEKDYVVYYLLNQELKRKIYANPLGSRQSSENTIMKNVSNLAFTYSPGITNAGQVNTRVIVSANVGRIVTLSVERLANLRNKE